MQSTALLVGLALFASCCVGAYAIRRHARRNKWELDNSQLIAMNLVSIVLPIVGLIALAVIMIRK